MAGSSSISLWSSMIWPERFGAAGGRRELTTVAVCCVEVNLPRRSSSSSRTSSSAGIRMRPLTATPDRARLLPVNPIGGAIMHQLVRRPLVPEDRRQHRPSVFLHRAAFAHALDAAGRETAGATSDPTSAMRIARQRWHDDIPEPVEVILRAATAPAMTSNPAWAGELARESVGDFIDDLAKFNAGANVINTARRTPLGRNEVLRFARRDDPRRAVGRWCGEAGPVPVPVFRCSRRCWVR